MATAGTAPGTAGTTTAGMAGTGSGGSAAGGVSGVSGAGGGGATNVSGMGGQSDGGASGGGAAGSAPNPEAVSVSPLELVFGAVQQTSAPAQLITLKNTGTTAATVTSVALDAAAPGTASFALMASPAAGTEIAAGQQLDLQVQFRPTGIALFESGVLIETSATEKTRVALFGLGTRGLEGENEPLLKIVLDTLGYDVDVGGTGHLSTTTPLVGSEVTAQRFKAAGAGAIGLIPVARYSPEEPIPYGYYTAQGEVEVGVISNDQYQALNPRTDAGSEPSFAAPEGEFGIFTTSQKHKTYTEDSKNAGNEVKHAVRTYPLKDRAGAAIKDAYLVCFEEAANGDYQDYVFTISNVVPLAP
jgi:hypothetical protein